MSLVSVIVPVYNAQAFLPRCLGSLLRQTLADFEAILVDDGSTDRSGAILAQCAQRDARFVVLRKPNGGAASARNLALDRARGRYVAFLDADDYLEDDALASLYALAERTGADVAQSNFCYEGAGGWRYASRPAFADGFFARRADFPRTVYPRMLTGIAMNHLTHALFRATLFAGVRLDEAMPTAEDLSCAIELYARAEGFAYTARPLYHYYRHAQALTGAHTALGTRFACNARASAKMRGLLLQGRGARLAGLRALSRLRPLLLVASKLSRLARNQAARLGKGALRDEG